MKTIPTGRLRRLTLRATNSVVALTFLAAYVVASALAPLTSGTAYAATNNSYNRSNQNDSQDQGEKKDDTQNENKLDEEYKYVPDQMKDGEVQGAKSDNTHEDNNKEEEHSSNEHDNSNDECHEDNGGYESKLSSSQYGHGQEDNCGNDDECHDYEGGNYPRALDSGDSGQENNNCGNDDECHEDNGGYESKLSGSQYGHGQEDNDCDHHDDECHDQGDTWGNDLKSSSMSTGHYEDDEDDCDEGGGGGTTIIVTPAVPAAPTVVCGPNNDVVVLPMTQGVTYTSTGWVNGSLTITATPNQGYAFYQGAVMTWTFTDANTSCGTVLGETTTVTPAAVVTPTVKAVTAQLADTGTSMTLVTLLSSGLLGAAILTTMQNTKRSGKIAQALRRMFENMQLAFVIPTA